MPRPLLEVADVFRAHGAAWRKANAGHMSLLVELRDSVTNQLLGRAVDTVQGRETANFEITNSVTNLGAARNALTKWANILVKGLNDADGRAK